MTFVVLMFIVTKFNDTTTLLYQFDKAVLEFINTTFAGKINDAIFSRITALGNAGVFWLMLCAVLIITPQNRRVGCIALLAIILGVIFGNLIIKTLVERLRPYQVDATVELIIKAPREYSFPSGHTLCSFGCASAIFINRKKLGSFMLAIAVLIAFSRLYLYVHFPTDIIGGILLGILMANLAEFIYDKAHEYFSSDIVRAKRAAGNR